MIMPAYSVEQYYGSLKLVSGMSWDCRHGLSQSATRISEPDFKIMLAYYATERKRNQRARTVYRMVPTRARSTVYGAVHVQDLVSFWIKNMLCPLHISRSDAPIVSRCCRLGQCEWSPDTESAVGASSGGHRAILNMFNIARRRRPIGSQTCTMQLRVVIYKTLSPYQPGSRTILYDSLVPTDALRATRPM